MYRCLITLAQIVFGCCILINLIECRSQSMHTCMVASAVQVHKSVTLEVPYIDYTHHIYLQSFLPLNYTFLRDFFPVMTCSNRILCTLEVTPRSSLSTASSHSSSTIPLICSALNFGM